MSRIIEFFVAPDETSAASVLAGGSEGTFETVTLGNFLVEISVLEWEELTTGTSFDALLDAGEPRSVAEDGDCQVFVVSERLLRELAGVDDLRIAELAKGWKRMRSEDGEDLDDEPAREILTEVSELARVANDQGFGLYCWVA
ncbi:hypothetical protein [Streptomyces glomeratus]|uniref:DUF1877 domain-containing protein n=1 Tax=Streptomyces glomeratus TaxID=284452 RepID=A0ABP6L008_9ACTN|nr:hypothetical protein [Streptomyces glomeratus]MCF1509091.1 hypothetical protein [Streptomyces glomeratus]